MIDFLQMIALTVFALGVIITIHEYGHFIVARCCGVKVLRFSLGFGKPILQWTDKRDTEYVIAMVPLGGYVRMLDERNDDVSEEDKTSTFNAQPVWQRFFIVAAGPIANFILAFIILYGLSLGNVINYKLAIDRIIPNTPAFEAGMSAGEEIVAINGNSHDQRKEFDQALRSYLGENEKTISITTKRISSKNEDMNTYVMNMSWDGHKLESANLNPYELLGIDLYVPRILTIVKKVIDGSPAQKGGLKAGDKIITTNQEPIDSWEEWVSIIKSHPGKLLQVDVLRNDQHMTLSLTPERVQESGNTYGRLGVVPEVDPWPEEMISSHSYNALEAFKPAWRDTLNHTAIMVLFLKKMVVGKVTPKHIGGPISIGKQASSLFKLSLRAYFYLIALLSVSIGVLNLLPIPVLDGGALVFLTIEGIIGRPVPEFIQSFFYKIGICLVLSFMFFAIYNDILKL
jgi:regulator of sigma E protease